MHNVVEKALPFTQTVKDRLNGAINRTINLYAKCVTRGDHSAAIRQLRVHQREHVRNVPISFHRLRTCPRRLYGNGTPSGVK